MRLTKRPWLQITVKIMFTAKRPLHHAEDICCRIIGCHYHHSQTSHKIRSSGNGYRTKKRFAKFNNLPELMAMYKEFADIRTSDMLMDMIIEIKKFRLEPRKIEPKKIYVFQNDANINYLSEQLCTIGEFNFSSKEQMCTKAERLKASIDGKTAKLKEMSDEIPTLKSDIAQLRHLFSVGDKSKRLDTMEQVKLAAAREIADKHNVKYEDDIAELEKRLKSLQSEVTSIKAELSDEQLKLKRVSDLITAYEKIVEGNYIDNLIRAQKEREQSKTIDNKSL